MEILKIEQFLRGNRDGREYNYGRGIGYGNGKGYCDGCGKGIEYNYGCGYGCGYGNGYGYGNGDGNKCGYGGGVGWGNGYDHDYGYGDGHGNSYGNRIKSINGYDVYRVDYIPTIFTHIHGNVAKGYILEQNVILKPCYIVKGNGYFAHGETLRDAQFALEEKILSGMDIEKKIKLFKEKFSDVNKKYFVKDFYQWHHILTGSCEIGRKSFARNHDIDIENDMMTVNEFISLTENAYRGKIIKELKESYGNDKL